MTTPVNTLTAVDINRVSESFTQANIQNFGFSALPKALCLDRFSGRSNVTSYDLAALDNALVANEIADWAPGIDPPNAVKLNEVSVSLTARIRSTRSLVRPLRSGQTFENRFADLERNIAPILLSKVYADLDNRLATILTNTNVFTQHNFTTNTDKGLDSTDDYSNQNPIVDIETQLRLLRPYTALGLELRAIMSAKVASVLSSHPSYNGGGAGSGAASGMAQAAFIETFSAIHGCKVHVINNLINTAELGQTASIAETFNQSSATAVLFFGLFDVRGGFDLRSQESADAPDGAVVYAEALAPSIVDHIDNRKSVHEFWGRGSGAIYSPRGTGAGVASDLGFFMRPVTAGANGGIFAT